MPANDKFLLPGDSRTFTIEYTAVVKQVPPGTKQLRLWVPVPHDTPLQSIRDLKFNGVQPTVGTEPKFGNTIAYWQIDNPPANVESTFSFTCMRKEQKTDLKAVA